MYKNIENVIEDDSMEYSAYILTNRAIPDLRDSCKPVVRRIIYTMHRENATKFSKSATMSGKVMSLHPHSDCYPTMVGMVQKDNQLLPWLEGKGNFSQHTSRDLMYASSRYTEIKLSPFAIEVLKGLNDKSVKFIPNYDGTIMMPEVLPVKFPMILNYCQSGIGMGMASNIPSFNMQEIAKAIDLYVKTDEKTNLIPDFATGGCILNNKEVINKINQTGTGTFILRGKCNIKDNIITINEIPFSTTREAIIDKTVELIKSGKFKEITNIIDLTGLKGMAIEVICKKNVDPNLVIEKLYKNTPLQSTFSANMNILYNGLPKVMGIWEVIDKWLEWRKECIIATYTEDIKNLENKLHLYQGLINILDYIDEVISIIRKTKTDKEIIINLCKRFNIDTLQAEHIADIKIRNLNKSNINKTIKNKDDLSKKILDLQHILSNDELIMNIILQEIKSIADTYGQPRKTEIIYEDSLSEISEEQLIESYNTVVQLTSEGYFKKIPATSMRGNTTNKLKDGDKIIYEEPSTNKSTILIFTSLGNCYKLYQYQINDVKTSQLGLYLPQELDLDNNEKIVGIINAGEDYQGNIIEIFENGNIAKIPVKSFETSTMRNQLKNSLCLKSNLIKMFKTNEDIDIILKSNINKVLITNTSIISAKGTKNAQGISIMKSKKGSKVEFVELVNNINDTKIDISFYKNESGKGIGVYLKKNDIIELK